MLEGGFGLIDAPILFSVSAGKLLKDENARRAVSGPEIFYDVRGEWAHCGGECPRGRLRGHWGQDGAVAVSPGFAERIRKPRAHQIEQSFVHA
eukprot:3716429-Pyramimonas_sp.AAC.1